MRFLRRHLECTITKLLSTNRCLIHQSTFFLGKYQYPISIFDISGAALGCCNSRRLCTQFKMTTLKLFHGIFVLKENNFPVSLASELKTHRYLFHLRLSNSFSLLIQNSVSASTTNTNGTFAHIREYD